MRKIPHWTETYSQSESEDILRELALTHALKGGKQGLRIAALIKRCDFQTLCDTDVDYSDISVYEAANCRQALAFFTKLEGLDIGVDKEEAAWKKFCEAEEACRKTNEILRLWSRGDFVFPPRVESRLFRAQRKIAMILGPVPSYEKLMYRFGKGATTLTKKRDASLREFFIAGCACSEELLPAAKAVLSELPHLTEAWGSYSYESSSIDTQELEEWTSVPITISDGRLDFVPKNAKTYRATVTEAPLNKLVQIAIGDFMVNRLAAFGIDLRDQSANQRRALEGSLTGALATLDQVSASDMIASELVHHLLPLEWASFLARARSGHVTYNGDRLKLEKFSSMGNGFTFPLESLIFWALASASCDTDDAVTVYGDDIVCPSIHFGAVVETLVATGFQVNEKKSFHTGPFRESCGCDYLRGIDIRPYYQKEAVSPRTLFVLHNFYVRDGNLEMAGFVRENFIHPSLQITGPDGYGDGHLIDSSWDRKRKPAHERKGYSGYFFDTFSLKAAKDTRPALPGDFVLPTYSIYRRGPEKLLPFGYTRNTFRPTVARNALGGFDLPGWWFLLRGKGALECSTAIPDFKHEDGSIVKAAAKPSSETEYKKVSIYTLRG